MKKNLFIALFFSVLGMLSLTAQTRNVLNIPDFTVANTSKIVLPVNLENTSDVVAVQFTLHVPSEVELTTDSVKLNPLRTADHSIRLRAIGENEYLCVIFSPKNKRIPGNEGTLLTVPLIRSGNYNTQPCPITLSDVVLATTDGSNVTTDFRSGNVTFRQLTNQKICSGTENATEDFYALSSLFDYHWALKEKPTAIAGYQENGKAAIPVMTLTNEGTEAETLTYQVKATYGGTTIYSFEYGIEVNPTLFGAFFNFSPRHGATVGANSIILTWNNIINAEYDVYLWPEGEEQPSSPIAQNLKETSLTVNSHCSLGETYQWCVVAHNQCQEMISETQKFTVRNLPDLHVTRVDCSDPVAGEKMTVEWTVKNDGSGSTEDAQWNDYIWLVPDMKLGTSTQGSKLLKTVSNVKALNPGESYINSCEVTLDERIYGKYNILVTSDMYSVTNIDWKTEEPIYPYNPTETGYLTATSASSYNKVAEATVNGKKDNFFYSLIDIAIPDLADLQIPSIQVVSNGYPVKEIFGGTEVEVIVTIQNKGNAPVVNKRVSNFLYFSNSGNHEAQPLTTCKSSTKTLNLAPNESCEERYTVTIPNRYYGDLYFHAYTDRNDDVYELANKENNWGTGDRINVIVTPGADLQPVKIATAQTQVSANQDITVSYSVENMGPGEPDAKRWTDRIYLCRNQENPTDGILLTSIPVTYSGSGYTKEAHVSLGARTGSYYICVVTDAYDNVFEYEGENNNALFTSEAITFVNPDLTVELNKIYNDTIKSNEEVSFEWKINNIGKGDLQDVRISSTFYVSDSPNGANARYLGTIYNDLWIAAGNNKLLRGSLIPSYGTTLDALQYVFVETAIENNIQEESENNNVSNKIQHWCKLTPKPVNPNPDSKECDLVITGADVPSELTTSNYVTAKWTCTNRGVKDAEAFTTSVYLSDNETWDKSDIAVADCQIKTLATEDSLTLSTTFYLKETQSNAKYLIFVADSKKAIKENNENNNTLICPVTIKQNPTVSTLPDLTISFAKAPSAIRTSEYLTVNWTCANEGEGLAGAFTNGIYLSDDEMPSEDDILLATQRTPSLKASEKIEYQTHLFIPQQYADKKYMIFVADIHEVTEETNKANNFRAVNVSIEQVEQPEPEDPDPNHAPDLSIDQMTVSGGGITTSTDFTLIWSCENTGTADATPFTTGFYLSDDEMLGEGDLFLNSQYTALIRKGSRIEYQTVLNIPETYNGNKYLIACADINNTVNESIENNNSKALLVTINKRPETPSADLRAEVVAIPEFVEATNNFTATWKVRNMGSQNAQSFLNLVCLSDDAARSNDDIILDSRMIPALNAGAETECSFTLNLPQNYTGKKFLIFVADANNSVVENNKSNNHAAQSVYIMNPPGEQNVAELSVDWVQMPELLTTSKEFDVTWCIKNNGTANASSFISAIYLSDDPQYSTDDILLSSERTALLKGESQMEYHNTLSIDDKYNGNKYLLFRTNVYESVREEITSNNIMNMPVSISCAPLPDLKVESLECEKEFTEGQEIKLITTITNQGEAETRQTRWTTEYYLSQNGIFNKDQAAKIGYSSHNGVLKPGESYTDTVMVTLPQDVNGNYMVYALVDATNTVYESNEKNNNNKGQIIQIYPVEERPVDLKIEKLTAPFQITAGENITVTYKVTNTGEYAAQGVLRDVIYLSEDDQWDYNDTQVGVVTGSVYIEAGQEIVREATGRIVNVPEGKYFFIIKTNSTRSIPEVNEDDNIGISSLASQVDFQTLQPEIPVQINTCGYYKMDINQMPSSQTMSFTLTHPEETSAGLYVGYESVPSTANYDFASFALSTEKQNVILPAAQPGRYYILAQDNASLINNEGYVFSLDGGSEWNETDMTLTASPISFGATSASMTQGGSDGWISTQIKGALFDSIMDFRLLAGEKMIPAERITFRDQTASDVTFNLRNAEVGTYDLVAELPNGTQATLPQGFHVVPGVQCDLGIKIDAPRVVHSGSHSPVTISLANGGTNDIQIKEIIVRMRGAYLGRTVAELQSEMTEIHLVPEGYETDRFGYISIPPGKQEVINFFMEQQTATSYMSVYIVK